MISVQAVRSLTYVALFYAWTVLVAVGFSPILLGPVRWTFWMFNFWGKGVVGMLPICGIRVEVRGREFIPQGAALVAPTGNVQLNQTAGAGNASANAIVLQLPGGTP